VRVRTYNCNSGCPVDATLDVIGGRWKGVLLFLLLDGPRRFGELRRLLPETTQRVLTLQLRELEADGVVRREIYPEIPLKVEYSLTDFGRSLEPILLQMRTWGERHTERLSMVREARIQKKALSEALTGAERLRTT